MSRDCTALPLLLSEELKKELRLPKCTDIRRILISESEPIVIGRASEFDYSGTQGYKAVREERYRVILVKNMQPITMATIEFSDRT